MLCPFTLRSKYPANLLLTASSGLEHESFMQTAHEVSSQTVAHDKKSRPEGPGSTKPKMNQKNVIFSVYFRLRNASLQRPPPLYAEYIWRSQLFRDSL